MEPARHTITPSCYREGDAAPVAKSRSPQRAPSQTSAPKRVRRRGRWGRGPAAGARVGIATSPMRADVAGVARLLRGFYLLVPFCMQMEQNRIALAGSSSDDGRRRRPVSRRGAMAISSRDQHSGRPAHGVGCCGRAPPRAPGVPRRAAERAPPAHGSGSVPRPRPPRLFRFTTKSSYPPGRAAERHHPLPERAILPFQESPR
jgi:hypothetical protein